MKKRYEIENPPLSGGFRICSAGGMAAFLISTNVRPNRSRNRANSNVYASQRRRSGACLAFRG